MVFSFVCVKNIEHTQKHPDVFSLSGMGLHKGGAVGVLCVNTWGSVGIKRKCHNVCKCVFQTLNSPQKNKMSLCQAPIHNSIIHHTYNDFFILLPNLQVIWQTCAMLNIRYFPWGKLGWEGPGTLLATGLPENNGCVGGTGVERHCSLELQSSPLTNDSVSPSLEPSCVARSVHYYTTTRHTYMHSLQHWCSFTTPGHSAIFSRPPASLQQFQSHSVKSQPPWANNTHSGVHKCLDSGAFPVVLTL